MARSKGQPLEAAAVAILEAHGRKPIGDVNAALAEAGIMPIARATLQRWRRRAGMRSETYCTEKSGQPISEAARTVIKDHGRETLSQVNRRLQDLGLPKVSQGTLARYRRRFGIPASNGAPRGEANPQWAPEGRRLSPQGYVMVRTISDKGRSLWRMGHIVEWEKVNGPIPRGKRLMCMGSIDDIRPENWRLMDHGAVTIASMHGPLRISSAPDELKPALASLAEVKAKLMKVSK